MPAKVDELFDEVKSTNPNYTDEQAWATAWSIYCKHVKPDSDSCHLPTSEYLKGKTAGAKLVEEVSDGGRKAYIFDDGGSLIVQMNYRGDKEEQAAKSMADARKKAKAMLESVSKYASGPHTVAPSHYDEVAREQRERELQSILKRTRQALQTTRTLLGEINFAGLPRKEQEKAEKLANEVFTILDINRGTTLDQLETLGVRTAAMQRTSSGDLRDLIEAVKDEYRRFDHEVEALDDRSVTLDVKGLDNRGAPFKAELIVYPARKSFALRFEGDSKANRMMKPEDLSNVLPTAKTLWWTKEARTSGTLAGKVMERFLAASTGKTAGWEGKMVGKEFRLTWGIHNWKLEELPAKGKRKLRVATLQTYLGMTYLKNTGPFIHENLLRDAHIGTGDSYDAVKNKLQDAFAAAAEIVTGGDPKLDYIRANKWYEESVHFLQVTPENVEPFEAEGKDFTVSCSWTKFKAYSPDSDFQSMDPSYTMIVSTAAASARKLYQILKADPNALKSIPFGKFDEWLKANKVNYELQFSVWR